jgi:hypothetical protein
MKSDRQLLCSILKTTQMVQIAIRHALKIYLKPGLKKVLKEQLREYDAIESEAHAIASERGWDLKEVRPGRQLMVGIRTRTKLSHSNSDSKIAGMMIQENTRHMITGLKDLHQYPQQDHRVISLFQRLLDCKTAAIRQLQVFI